VISDKTIYNKTWRAGHSPSRRRVYLLETPVTTAFITHSACLEHDMGNWHPEAPARLHAIEDQLVADRLMDFLRYHQAPLAEREHLTRVHDSAYIDKVLGFAHKQGYVYLDPDTMLTPKTPEAALRAAGAVILATELVLEKKARNAFCNIRPPGHHATPDTAMGFCFFNNVAVGVAHALEKYCLSRVAICDFDVHHGNGTETIFDSDSRVMLCSTFQHPFYPNTPLRVGHPLIVNGPLAAGSSGVEFRQAVRDIWLPALRKFSPQMIFFSAGFDAHADDDMAQLRLHSQDYAWVTQQVRALAEECAEGRMVSVLEGGYELSSLGRSASAHIKVLMGLG
jgi:acetoin utilization deacetylase AcuC-like enzyme